MLDTFSCTRQTGLGCECTFSSSMSVTRKTSSTRPASLLVMFAEHTRSSRLLNAPVSAISRSDLSCPDTCAAMVVGLLSKRSRRLWPFDMTATGAKPAHLRPPPA